MGSHKGSVRGGWSAAADPLKPCGRVRIVASRAIALAALVKLMVKLFLRLS